jgi:hypothetical protein
MKKMYKEYLKEFFGPNKQKIYIKYQNMWADDINDGLAKCQAKWGGTGNVTLAQNHYCYYSSRLAATPKFIENLKNAAKTECKGDETCSKFLLQYADAYGFGIPELKVEVKKYLEMMKKEADEKKKTLKSPIARQK